MKTLKNNRQGFTLVELIVVIAIMGVILILALPQVTQIQSANKTKKYATYKDSFTAAAKIYVDNHKVDLFGNKETGCVTITYDDLKRDNLIKDFSEKGVNCNYNDATKIDVTKNYDQYYYATDITCTKDGKQVYQKKDSSDAGAVTCNAKDSSSSITPGSDCIPGEKGCSNPEGCDSSGKCPDSEETPPDIRVTPTSSKQKWYTSANIVKNLKLQFYVYDSDGLNKNISIQWTWKNKWTNATSTYSHNFKNKASKTTTKVTLSVPEKKIPKATGRYSVVLSPKSTSTSYGVQDFLGNVRYTSSGTYEEYWIDNVAPKMNPAIKSSDSKFQSLNTKITLSASDDVGVDQMYISNKEYETGGKWQSYKDSFDWKLDGKYDGKERTIYITIKDLAGNKTNKKITYTVYQSCKEKVNDGDWYDITTCSASCGDGKKTQEIKQKDKYLGDSCGVKQQSDVKCKLHDCCGSGNVKYTDGSNCTVSCGGGTLNRIATSKWNGQACPNDNKNDGGSACNTDSCVPPVPKSTCNIRGSKLRPARSPSGWTCQGPGIQHSGLMQYYQIYCSDEYGNISKSIYPPNANAVCPVAPFGPNEGWYVLDDTNIP